MGDTMLKSGCKKVCVKIRHKMFAAVMEKMYMPLWLQSHVAACPRCQKRLVRVGRVGLAFSILKSQPHSFNLLMRANTCALKMLKHSLREDSKAEKLRNIQVQVPWIIRAGAYIRLVFNLAACIVFVVLLKTGIFSSFDDISSRGQEHIENYYARHFDQQTFNDVFMS